MNPMRSILIFLLLIVAISCDKQQGNKVIKVTDGDTFDVMNDNDQEVTIRLYGVDCPESSQPYGDDATEALRGRILDESVKIEKVSTGTYGRTIAKVYHEGTMINEWLVEEGLAWVYNRYCDQSVCDDWENIQHNKRNEGVGLWSQSSPTPPWEYRN